MPENRMAGHSPKGSTWSTRTFRNTSSSNTGASTAKAITISTEAPAAVASSPIRFTELGERMLLMPMPTRFPTIMQA